LDPQPKNTEQSDENVCPDGNKLGLFNNNRSHSNIRYGLRIFHGLMPRTNPCDHPYDSSLEDPFSYNTPIEAHFSNFVGFKNQRNCIITENTGLLRFTNMKCVDNQLGAMENFDTY